MQFKRPFSNIWIQRLMLVVIMLLAYAAGYYHSALQVEKERVMQLQEQCSLSNK